MHAVDGMSVSCHIRKVAILGRSGCTVHGMQARVDPRLNARHVLAEVLEEILLRPLGPRARGDDAAYTSRPSGMGLNASMIDLEFLRRDGV